MQIALQNKIIELCSTYASLPDAVTERMTLAYVQLVHILSDGLVLFTPFALLHSVGSFSVVCGTAVVTLFHASIVTLAKLFLDPFNNEVEQRGGDPGIGGIEVQTLMQETNVGSERWRRSALWVPDAVRLQPSTEAHQDAAAQQGAAGAWVAAADTTAAVSGGADDAGSSGSAAGVDF